MVNQVSEVVLGSEIGEAVTEVYTLDMAIIAMNTVDECMEWAQFGVGGPA